MSEARWISRMSGPWSSSPNRISTADRRPPSSGGAEPREGLPRQIRGRRDQQLQPGRNAHGRLIICSARTGSCSRCRGRAQSGHRAGCAGGLARETAAAAVENQSVRDHRPVPGTAHRVRTDADRVGLLRPAQACDSRCTWVSTVNPGWSKALPLTTWAVLRPTPGSFTNADGRGSGGVLLTHGCRHGLQRRGLVPENRWDG